MGCARRRATSRSCCPRAANRRCRAAGRSRGALARSRAGRAARTPRAPLRRRRLQDAGRGAGSRNARPDRCGALRARANREPLGNALPCAFLLERLGRTTRADLDAGVLLPMTLLLLFLVAAATAGAVIALTRRWTARGARTHRPRSARGATPGAGFGA